MKGLFYRIVAPATAMTLLLGGLQAASPKSTSARHDELEKTVMGYVWSFNSTLVVGGMKDMRFWNDSAVTPASQPEAIIGVWHVSIDGEVKILYGRGSVMTLRFNENAGTYSGSDGAASIKGRRLDPLLPRGVVKKMQPVAAEIPSRPGQAKIDVLAEQGSAVTAGVIVQLDATALDHHAAITKLRDDLADEAATRPAASPETYQAAARLCNAWLFCLDERDKRAASYGQARPVSIMGAAHSTDLRPGDYLRYLADVTLAHRKVLEELAKDQFFSDTAKKQWLDRCVTLRQGLDSLQEQIEAAVQQRKGSK